MTGVSPSGSSTFASAPAARRRSIIAALPFSAASQRGVAPSSLAASTSAPAARSSPAMCRVVAERGPVQGSGAVRLALADVGALLQQALHPVGVRRPGGGDQRELVGAGAGRGDGRGRDEECGQSGEGADSRHRSAHGDVRAHRDFSWISRIRTGHGHASRQSGRGNCRIMLPQVRPVWNPGGPRAACGYAVPPAGSRIEPGRIGPAPGRPGTAVPESRVRSRRRVRGSGRGPAAAGSSAADDGARRAAGARGLSATTRSAESG